MGGANSKGSSRVSMTTLMLTSGFPPVPATRTSNVLDSQHTCGRGLPASFGPCSHTGARAGLEGERAGVGVRQHLQTRRKPGPRDSPTPLSSRPIPREQQRVERITHVLLAARTCSHQREAGTPFCPCRRSPILTCIFPSHPAAPTPGLLTPRRDPTPPPTARPSTFNFSGLTAPWLPCPKPAGCI